MHPQDEISNPPVTPIESCICAIAGVMRDRLIQTVDFTAVIAAATNLMHEQNLTLQQKSRGNDGYSFGRYGGG
ncbi:hypothetical protein AY600_05190 [Phormidium willei BDU 130791]|nr:hypothetical protein AY600_05190 [Phormidium willei BDU 130791]